MAGERVKSLIQSQEQVWSEALSRAVRLPLTPPIVFVGSGSSYYLAQAAMEVARRLGVLGWSAPSGEVWSEPEPTLLGARSALVISRSGTTSEALLALASMKRQGLSVYGLTCNPHTPLMDAADAATMIPADDNTVVMVQSFTAMLLWMQASLALRSGEDLRPLFAPGLTQSVLQQSERVVGELLKTPPRRTIYLGAGARYGVAQEGALKALEMGGGEVLWYHPLEFRHGPWGSVDTGDVVFVLAQEALAEREGPLMEDLQKRGATVVEVSRTPTGRATHTISLPDAVPDVYLGPVAAIPLQWYAWAWSLLLGRDPDQPRNLSKVVRLD